MSQATNSPGGGPPPLPPKATRGTIGKGAAPAPPLGAQPPVLGVQSMNIKTNKADSNLVTIDLKANSTITIKVDRGTSLQCLHDVASSNSDFKFKPGNFDLWYKDKKGKENCIKNEDIMRKLWTDIRAEDYLSLSCKGKK